jgi:hypothetical protein
MIPTRRLTAAGDSNGAIPAPTRPARSPRSGTAFLPLRTPPDTVAKLTEQKGDYEGPPAGALRFQDGRSYEPEPGPGGWLLG